MSQILGHLSRRWNIGNIMKWHGKSAIQKEYTYLQIPQKGKVPGANGRALSLVFGGKPQGQGRLNLGGFKWPWRHSRAVCLGYASPNGLVGGGQQIRVYREFLIGYSGGGNTENTAK